MLLNALLIFVGGIRSGFLSGSNAAAAYSSSSSSAFCLHTAITAAPPPIPPPITLPVPAPHKSCRRWFRCRRDRTRSAHITAAAATADTMVMAKRPATTGVSRKRSLPPAPTADEPVTHKSNNIIFMIILHCMLLCGVELRKLTQMTFGKDKLIFTVETCSRRPM